MNLPTLNYPIYDLELTTGKKIKIRPFLVKEKKLLLMAIENADMNENIKVIKDIIGACILDNVDVDELALIDIEKLFIMLKSKSDGEILETYFTCKNEVDDKECNMVIEIPINLNELKVEDSKISSTINLTDAVHVKMKYPTFDLLEKLNGSNNDIELELSIVSSCIESIYDENDVYLAKNATQEELTKFVESIPENKYEMLMNFVRNTPRIKYEHKHKCPKCNFEHDIKLEGLSDFFI